MIEAPARETTEAPARETTERVTPLKPSEAIRLGSLGLSQLCGRMFAFDNIDTLVGACAWGAMRRGGYSGPMLNGICPVCRMRGDHVIHLNDAHYWSFSQIAQWLEDQGQ